MAGSDTFFVVERELAARLIWRASWAQQAVLAVEYVALFWLGPLAYVLGWAQPHPLVALAGLTAICVVVLWRDPTFDRKQLWSRNGLRQSLVSILLILLMGGMLTVAALAAWLPERLFSFPVHSPGMWLAVLVLYPLLSVYPQEVVWRVFAFHRYRSLFGEGAAAIAVSAVAFAWVHVVYGNWVAPALSLVGGVLFGWRYLRTRSLAAVSLEHMLWGQLLFFVGLWEFFYQTPAP